MRHLLVLVALTLVCPPGFSAQRRPRAAVKPAAHPGDLQIQRSPTNAGLRHGIVNGTSLLADRHQVFGYSAMGMSFPRKAPDPTTRSLFNDLARTLDKHGLALEGRDIEGILTPAERRTVETPEIEAARRVIAEVVRSGVKNASQAVLQRANKADEGTREVLRLVVARVDRLAQGIAKKKPMGRPARADIKRAGDLEGYLERLVHEELPDELRKAGIIDTSILPKNMPPLTQHEQLLAGLGRSKTLQPLLAHLTLLKSGREQFAYVARQAGNLQGSELGSQRALGQELSTVLATYIDTVWGEKRATRWLGRIFGRRAEKRTFYKPSIDIYQEQRVRWGSLHLQVFGVNELEMGRMYIRDDAQEIQRKEANFRAAYERLAHDFTAVSQLVDPTRRETIAEIVGVAEKPTRGASYYAGYELQRTRGSPSYPKPAIAFGGEMGKDAVPELLAYRLTEAGGYGLNMMLNDLLIRRSYGKDVVSRNAGDERENAGVVDAGFTKPHASYVRAPRDSDGSLLGSAGDRIGPNHVLNAHLAELTTKERALQLLRKDPETTLLLLQHLQSPVDD